MALFKYIPRIDMAVQQAVFNHLCTANELSLTGYNVKDLGQKGGYSMTLIESKSLKIVSANQTEMSILSPLSGVRFPSVVKCSKLKTEYQGSDKIRVSVSPENKVSINLAKEAFPLVWDYLGIMMISDQKGGVMWDGMEKGVIPRFVEIPSRSIGGHHVEAYERELERRGWPYIMTDEGAVLLGAV
jgi:hypothetical protein